MVHGGILETRQKTMALAQIKDYQRQGDRHYHQSKNHHDGPGTEANYLVQAMFYPF